MRRYGFWQRWLAGQVIPAPPRSLPVYEQRRQVLALAGYTLVPARFDLAPPVRDAAWARNQVPAEAVHLSISASTPFKEWPVSAWGDLAQRLLAGGVPVLVATGSPTPRERARLEELARTVDDDRLRVIAEALPIPRRLRWSRAAPSTSAPIPASPISPSPSIARRSRSSASTRAWRNGVRAGSDTGPHAPVGAWINRG